MKKWTLRVLLCLFLGLITTYAVTFVCELPSYRFNFDENPERRFGAAIYKNSREYYVRESRFAEGHYGVPFRALRVWSEPSRYSPIWAGFLADLVFYAAIWFGVFFGFTSAKRAIRRKRGRCPRCGYDLRGGVISDKRLMMSGEGAVSTAGCPECGWNRVQEETESSPKVKRSAQRDGETK